METTVEITDLAGLIQHVHKLLEPFYFDRERIATGLEIKPYGWKYGELPLYDPRIGWPLYIVTLKGYGVLGFANGPL